jgi:hypothetical protein
MVSPTFDASLHPTNLILIVPRAEAFKPTDDVYVENPYGAYRGLCFALACNLIVAFVGVAGWEIWRLLH